MPYAGTTEQDRGQFRQKAKPLEDERDLVSAAAALIDCNPFLPKRLELERRVLGDAFTPVAAVWHADTDDATVTPNAVALRAVVERLATRLQQRLAAGTRATPAERAEPRIQPGGEPRRAPSPAS